ncbi:MAG: radical SAM protein [Candidatus Zixiibacteriota bacterium]
MNFTMSAPNEVRLELTRKCNLRCIHCFNNSSNELKNELSTAEVYHIIDQLFEMRAFDIMIEGGEVFTRKDILYILQYMSGKFKLGISTNGLLINEDLARRLSPIVDYIQISIDGANAAVNDKIRGNGSYDMAIKAIKACVNNNIPIGMGMVLTKLNVHQITDYIELGKSLGATACNFSRLQHTGRAKLNNTVLELSINEFIDAQRKIDELIEKENSLVIGCNLYCYMFLLNRKRCREQNVNLINANIECVETLTILSNGDVIPCSGLPTFIVGNVRKDSLRNIWDNSPILNELRSIKVEGKCEFCEFVSFCRGGCRGEAFLQSGNIKAPDPLCWKDE